MIGQSRNFLLASAFTVGVNFLTLPLFTLYLSPSDYGLIGLFLLFGSTFANLFSFGLNTASYGLFFKLEEAEFKILNTTVFIFLISVFALLANFLVFPFVQTISNYLFDGKLDSYLLKLSVLNGCIAYFYSFYGQILIARERSLAYALSVICQVTLNASTTFYLILFYDLTYIAAIWGGLIANTLALILVLFFNHRLFTTNISSQKLRRGIKFGWPEVPNILVSTLYGGFDKTMLVNYQNLSQVGHYEFGGKFAAIFKIFSDALGKVFSPFFLKSIALKSMKVDREIMSQFYSIAFWLTFLGIFLSYFSEEALIILTTSEFYVAKYLVPILVSYYLFGVMGHLSMNQLIAAEKLYVLAPISILGLICNISLNVFLIPIYGAVGAAIATSISACITSCVMLYFGNKASPLPIKSYKLIAMYGLFFLFVIFGYLIMNMDESILFKFFVKVTALTAFMLLGIKYEFVKFSQLTKHSSRLIDSIKIMVKKR